jgi:hypothetical protein
MVKFTVVRAGRRRRRAVRDVVRHRHQAGTATTSDDCELASRRRCTCAIGGYFENDKVSLLLSANERGESVNGSTAPAPAPVLASCKHVPQGRRSPLFSSCCNAA